MQQHHSLDILEMMEWIPVVFVAFKFLVLSTGMFYAIKWHYDQGKKKKKPVGNERRAVMRAGGKVAAVFVLALAGLGLVTFVLMKTLGMDVGMP